MISFIATNIILTIYIWTGINGGWGLFTALLLHIASKKRPPFDMNNIQINRFIVLLLASSVILMGLLIGGGVLGSFVFVEPLMIYNVFTSITLGYLTFVLCSFFKHHSPIE